MELILFQTHIFKLDIKLRPNTVPNKIVYCTKIDKNVLRFKHLSVLLLYLESLTTKTNMFGFKHILGSLGLKSNVGEGFKK